jgi:hypothetical protein
LHPNLDGTGQGMSCWPIEGSLFQCLQALMEALLIVFKRLHRDAEVLYLCRKLICEGFRRDSAGLLQSAYPVLECLFSCIHEGLNISYHLRHTL